MHMQTVTRAVETTKPRRAQDSIKKKRIEILKHIEFQYGGSKIQGFKGGHIEILRPY